MQDNSEVTLALIAIVGTVITALFKLLNDNTKALTKVAVSSEKVAVATAKSAKEAKQRNGHLGEQTLQLANLVTKQNSDLGDIKETNNQIATTLNNSALIAAEDRDTLTSNSQVVHEQQVEHQIVQQLDSKKKG